MLKNNEKLTIKGGKRSGSRIVYGLLLAGFCLLAVGCRYDMQDQPRYKYYKKSDFFTDGRASRDLPEGTVSRGNLRETVPDAQVAHGHHGAHDETHDEPTNFVDGINEATGREKGKL